MAITVSPSTEAMEVIVARINSGTTYTLKSAATYSEEKLIPLECIDGTRIDVVEDDQEQLNETLDSEDRSSHRIRVWVRKGMVVPVTNAASEEAKLLVRRIWQRLNNHRTSRVCVWECDEESKEVPDKSMSIQEGVFVASILCRVEVEAS